MSTKVEDGLKAKIAELCQSPNTGEAAIGLILAQHLRFTYLHEVIPALRTVSLEMESALHEFNKTWQELAF
jgi:hypothetical protein